MPRFSRDLPDEPAHHSYTLRRTPPAKPLIGIVTCSEAVACPTHFASRRTVPCEGKQLCRLCKDGHSWRMHVYVSALDPASGEHYIFETTRRGADAWKAYLNAHGTLRGCHYKATRIPAVSNGRVTIQTKPADLHVITLPDPPEIERILCHIWDVPYTGAAQTPAAELGGRRYQPTTIQKPQGNNK